VRVTRHNSVPVGPHRIVGVTVRPPATADSMWSTILVGGCLGGQACTLSGTEVGAYDTEQAAHDAAWTRADSMGLPSFWQGA